MKESTLIDMQKKIESLTNLVGFLLNETNNIKTLASGSFETLRLMPGYNEAVAALAERVAASNIPVEENNEEPKLDLNGVE